MIRAMRTAATGMFAQQLYVDTIANNLANVNTTGFKKNVVEFQDLLYQTVRDAGTSQVQGTTVPTEVQVGHGTRTVSTQKIFTQGDIRPTENPLDDAIEGNGFYQILQPDGTIAYTRDGTFKISQEGSIVTSDGFALQPEITIPQDAVGVNIGLDGNVSVLISGQTEPQILGQIEIVRFINPAGLKNIGRNLYQETLATGDPIQGTPGEQGFGLLRQGLLELSNVQVVEELVNMIVAQRAYEINARAVRVADDMMETAASIAR